MKKNYFFFALLLTFSGLMSIQAQTDVTATYLTNADFDTPPYCYTVAGGTVLNAGIVRIGTTGWIFEIPGWTNESVVNANAVQVATGEHSTPANAQGFNNVAVPATNKAGVSTGAAVSMSAGWGDKAMYMQNVTLPSGRYVLKLDLYNAHTVAAVAANYTGFIPTTGTASYCKKKSFTPSIWITDSVSFYLVEETAGKINLGFTTSSNGSANGAKFFLDNVKLIYYGIDKTDLKGLIDSAIVMKNNPQDVGASTVYTDLQSAIDAAQVVYNKTAATAAEVVAQETALKTAMENIYGAIILQTRKNTWTALPYNATEAIINPGFETVFDPGWNNEGLFARQTNTSFDPLKVGTYYAEKWITSGTVLSNLRISQMVKNIPNGVYLVTASAHATQQLDNSYPGGMFLFGNDAFVEIFERKDYNATVQVTDNTLEIGFEVAESGNWVAFDNFRLSYISDGSPYLVTDPASLTFSPSVAQKTFRVTGGNLAGDVSLTTTAAFTLSKNTLTAAEVLAEGGAEVTVTAVSGTAVANDSIVITQGTARQKISLSVKEVLSLSNTGLVFDQSLTPVQNITVSGDLYAPVTISAPSGISLSESNISTTDALAGKEIVIMWDGGTLIEDKYIYLNSGSKKDSVLVFATANNLITLWDGNDATGEGTRLTDFGWTLMMADGITPVTATFNNYEGTSGIRLVPLTTQNYMYRGKPWKGYRVAYLRTWGDPSTNVFNFPVTLEAGKTYMFRGIASWHDNETNPTFSYGINTLQSNLGDTLGIVSQAFTVKRIGLDYTFKFKPATTGTHYMTVSSTVKGDVMSAPFFLSIHETSGTTATETNTENQVKVYPTIARGSVMIETGGRTGMVRVFDITGKLAGSKILGGGAETINLPSEGVYFLQINAGQTVKTVKVISVK